MALKLVWRVEPRPTGRDASFQTRGWPSAELEDGTAAVSLHCADEYVPADVRAGRHGPITIKVADRRPETIAEKGAWIWRTLKRKAATLDEAKAIVAEFMTANPHVVRPVEPAAGPDDGAAPPALGR
jgi:hypothetical protein